MEHQPTALPDSGNISRKIVSISAGEAHTVALTGDGCVYSWGRGMFGRLGTGSESDELAPIRVGLEFPGQPDTNRVKIVGVSAGAYHSLALSDDGSVWCWGYNLYGQLGFDGENLLTPRLMDQFLKQETSLSPHKEPLRESKSPFKVCSVKAGGMMSLAIDNAGGLWMWGNIPHKDKETESCFSFSSTVIPTPVSDFHGQKVLKVACGNEHVVALVGPWETFESNNGDLMLYSWGSNGHGQLGLGDRENRARPHIVEKFNMHSGFGLHDVACGAHHTAVLTYEKDSSKEANVCWTFGLGENGQLGLGNTKSSLVPEQVKDLPEQDYFVSVDCGLFHTSVVSSEGYVWLWGMEKGLGLCPEASFTEPEAGDAITPRRLLDRSRFPDPVQISCGAAHSVLVANGGHKIWSWGRGRNGLLGSGNTIDSYTPTAVLWPNDHDPANIKVRAETGSDLKEEIQRLEAKLLMMERYASLLHGSIFGKPFSVEEDIPDSLRVSGYFEVGREWEQMLETAEQSHLIRLKAFYEDMRTRVKDKLLQRRIHEILKDCLQSSTPGN